MNHYAGRMTRTYAARKLLEHGPLTHSQFLEITGWNWRTVDLVTQRLMGRGEIVPVKIRGMCRRGYALASSPIAHGSQPSTVQRPSEPFAGTTNCFLGWN